MLDAADIFGIYQDRKAALYDVHAAGALLERVYEGRLDVTLPELDANERSAVANIVQMGLDGHAQRIGSVMPIVTCPTTKSGQAATKRANDRRLTLQAWWYLNNMKMKVRRRARHLPGYAMSPVLVRPGRDGYPVWEIRNPLASYPSTRDPDDLVPHDTIFELTRSVLWLRSNYPAIAYGKDLSPNASIQILQYISAEQYTLVMVGKAAEGNYLQADKPIVIELSTVPNRAQRPCVVVPGRITLNRLQGQFDQLIGMYEMEAKLWALQLHAVQREIFGETWAVGTNPAGGKPRVNVVADPYDGTIGEIEDGDIKQFRIPSSQGPNQAIDRLERNQRTTGAVPAEMGGEAASNIRTGRRGSQVFSSAVDFHIQEHQELLAASLEEENKIAVAIAKAYWGDTARTFQVPSARGSVTYTPNTTFETDIHFVSYSYAGADTNSLVIEGGQRIGQGTLSKQSFMEIDPLVSDPDAEHDRIIAEGLELAGIQSIQQQAAMPDGPYTPAQMARLTKLVVEDDKTWFDAIEIIDREAQEAQAAAAAQTPMGQAGLTAGPEAQPGLAGAPPPIGEPVQGIQNLTGLLQNLRRPQMGAFGPGGGNG